MDIIAVIVSVLSFSLSLAISVRTFLREKERFTVEIIDYRKHFDEIVLFLLCISNQSDTPLVITQIRYGGILCRLEPTEVAPGFHGGKARLTPDFPLCIPARSAQYAYLLFRDEALQNKQLTAGTAVSFQIQTTRHPSRKTIYLPHTGCYLHREK